MAHIKTINFSLKNKTDESLAFNGAVSVDRDGMFAIAIPDELVETAKALAQERRANASGPPVLVCKPRLHTRVECTNLEVAERFVRDAMAAHLAVEVTRQRIICYSFSARYAAWENKDGTLHPNGSWGDYDAEDHGRFIGPLNATVHESQYTIGLAAGVFDRVTYTRPSHSKVVLERLQRTKEESHWDKNPMERLKGFIGLGHFKPNEHTPWIPYSDEAALFFADMLTGISGLAERLGAFLNDRQQLQRAIEAKTAGPLRLTQQDPKGESEDQT